MPVPTITNISPLTGVAGSGVDTRGTTITITGTNLSKVGAVVFANGRFAAKGIDSQLTTGRVMWGVLTIVSPTQLRFTIPPDSSNSQLIVTGGDGTSAKSAQTLAVTG